MKRFHLHIGVEHLDQAITFYTKLFGVEPVKRKPDYAKWMLEDPHVNFAISTRASTKGLDHLGIQVDEEQELNEIRQRLKAESLPVAEEGETLCCYAHSDKSWLVDPAGIPWEAYRTMEEAEVFSGARTQKDNACCGPLQEGNLDTNHQAQEPAGCCS